MSIALWNWQAFDFPITPMIVASPFHFRAANKGELGGPMVDPQRVHFAAWAMETARAAGRHVIVPDTEAVWWLASSQEPMPERLTPALYVERQSDLAGAAALLAVKAERRALVISPREPIDLGVDLESTAPLGVLACRGCNGWGGGETGGFDVNGPIEAECGRCKGMRTAIDVVVVAPSADEEPRTISADWVAAIKKQCALAEVPFVDLTSSAQQALPEWAEDAS